jgi:hypothetical protein
VTGTSEGRKLAGEAPAEPHLFDRESAKKLRFPKRNRPFLAQKSIVLCALGEQKYPSIISGFIL